MMGNYRVYREGFWPEPKKKFYQNEFPTRQKARNFCRNRSWEPGLTIVYPDGFEEPYDTASKTLE